MTKLERVTSHVVIRGRHPNEFVSEFKNKRNLLRITLVDC